MATTFLIVDDNRQMRFLMKEILRKASDFVYECEDGSEVLAAYNSHKPDWVLMDVEMNRVDGITATAELITHHPQAKIIVVTKYNDANTQEAALRAGAMSFLGKDNLIELRSIVQPALGR